MPKALKWDIISLCTRYFKNVRADFVLRCQKLPLQTTPEMIHFEDWKKEYYVVAFDTINIFTHWAPQNDHQNLSFVKDIYVVAKKWPQMVKK